MKFGSLSLPLAVSAAATNPSRMDLLVLTALRTAKESRLRAIAANTPKTKSIICVRRLYQPETRSIALLNQSSKFFWACARSPLARSTAERMALCTCELGSEAIELRTASKDNCIGPQFDRFAAQFTGAK